MINKISFLFQILILFLWIGGFSYCSKKGKVLVLPFRTSEQTLPEAKIYITEDTVTPPIFDYSNESSLPVDFGGNLSANIDAPDLQYVDRFKPIAILFSSMMNKASVESAFTLKDSSDQIVDGTFFWSGSKLYFKPYHPLNPRETYTVTINTNAKDFDGNSLAQDFVQSFTTEAAFLMNHTLKVGTNSYNVSSTASQGVLIDKNAYTGNLIIESTLTGANYVTRVRLFKLGVGEDNAYTICDSSLLCNNDTPETGKFTTDLSSLNSLLQPKEGTNIYYYYIETTSGRTYVRPFAFQYGRPSSNPNELQSNGGWLALENNTTYGMYQIKRLFERFIKSDGSHTGDNFTINGKKFNDYLNEPKSYPPTYGPINSGGCQLDYSDWLNPTNRINYLTNFGPYCNLSFEVCGTGYADNYVGYMNIPPTVDGSTNVNVNMLPNSSSLKIELLGRRLNGMLRSYVRDGGGCAYFANGYVIEDRFFMNESTPKSAYANTTLTVDANGDLKITILGGPNWAIDDPNFDVKPWSDSINSTSDWSIVKGSWLDWLLSIFIPNVINQLTPKIVQGTIKDTIQKVSANIMNAVLSKTRVDGINDGINICLPGYLPDPLRTICLTTGAKMKTSSTHTGWTHSGYNGIRSYLEANMTVTNSNASWPRPPALLGPGNKGFLKFLPSSFVIDNNLVSLFSSKGYKGALVVLNPDVVNQAAYGLWKEGAFNFIITKPVLEQINSVAGQSNLTTLADKLLKADAILTVIAPGQSNFVVKDQSNNTIIIEKNDPVKIETILLYPPDVNPVPNWKSTGQPEEYLLNNASFTGFKMKLIGGKDSNNDGVPDYNFYTIATIVVNLSTKATINFIQYSNPNNYIPACSDGHCRALSINISTEDQDMRYTIDVLEDPINNPLGLDPRGIYDVFNPLIKSFVAPLVGNVLKEIPFDADMSACGIKINEVKVEKTPTSYNDPFAILNIELGEQQFSGDCDF